MWKTPSSLKWLTKKSSRVAGMVEATSQAVDEFRPQALRVEAAAVPARAQLDRMKAKLAGNVSMMKSVDDALSIHEIEIDPVIIKSASIGSARLGGVSLRTPLLRRFGMLQSKAGLRQT